MQRLSCGFPDVEGAVFVYLIRTPTASRCALEVRKIDPEFTRAGPRWFAHDAWRLKRLFLYTRIVIYVENAES